MVKADFIDLHDLEYLIHSGYELLENAARERFR